MNGRSIFILVLAVAVGLGAMVFTRKMLSGGQKKEDETREVLVATRDFKEEETIKPDMVQVIRMAKSAVPPSAFSSYTDVQDRWVKNIMMEGDVLVEKKLGPKGTPPGLVANIPMGMRAFAIDVTEQSGVSGFILPGHHVDVVRHDANDKNEHRAESILQNVLVLATGQVFTRQEERTVQSRTVTLALKPAEVDILVAARSRGYLSLSLRGVNDHDIVAHQAPKPQIDPEHEKRLKLEESKRLKLEEELQQLKDALARKPPEPPRPAPAPAPRKAPRIATIYRGIHNAQRILIDRPATAELDPQAINAFPDSTASQTPDDAGEPKVASAGNRTEP
jgi:pilus assembly protein CpaB